MIDHPLETFKAKALELVSPITVHREHVAIRDKLPIGIKKTAGSWIYPMFDNLRVAAELQKFWPKGEGK